MGSQDGILPPRAVFVCPCLCQDGCLQHSLVIRALHPGPRPFHGSPTSLSRKASRARPLHPSPAPSSLLTVPRGDPHRGCRMLERHLGGLQRTQPWLSGRQTMPVGMREGVGGGWHRREQWPQLRALRGSLGSLGMTGDPRAVPITGEAGTARGAGPCRPAVPTQPYVRRSVCTALSMHLSRRGTLRWQR